jgi:predicted homoserine dehydrogenase-like protein
MTMAKRDLVSGEKLDTFGGFTFYGVMECAKIAREGDALPVGLAPGAVMDHPVCAGEIIRWQDVRLDEQQPVVKLRRMQDQLS